MLAWFWTWIRRSLHWDALFSNRSNIRGGRASPLLSSAMASLRLGESAQPLLAQFAEPAIRVLVHDTVPLIRFDDTRTITVALAGERIVAIRYRYPFVVDSTAMDSLAADVDRFLSPEAQAAGAYQLLLRHDGWLLATVDCPPACLAAVDAGP